MTFPDLSTKISSCFNAIRNRISYVAVVLLLNIVCLVQPAMADIIHRDGEGEQEPCPIPRFCSYPTVKDKDGATQSDTFDRSANITVNSQDNGYHNTLQAMRGPTGGVNNVKETAPGDDTVSPIIPPTYSNNKPDGYDGVFGSYKYGGNGIPYIPAKPPYVR